jgi:kumamolisin
MTSSYATDFHDIASGTSGSFSALPGYDLVTGWGTPNGSGLISALTTTTTAPGFSLSASSPSEFLTLGKSSSVVVTVSVSGGFSSAIALSAVGEPAGVHISFSPSSINAPGGGSSQMILSLSRHVSIGTYPITITAIGGGIAHTITLDFTVRR